MLMSGSGRHRKPRQAPTAVVAVAATGAGMALPLFAATGAQAAGNVQWTAVALCESGGLWSSNTGNGFYGGLQISQGTWDDYGGKEFAERPDLASITQQMEVADRILASLGPDAWPGCAEKAGLEKEDAGASVSASPSGDSSKDSSGSDSGTSLGDLLDPGVDSTPSADDGTDDGSKSGSTPSSPTPSSPTPSSSAPSSAPSSPSPASPSPFSSSPGSGDGSQAQDGSSAATSPGQGQPEGQDQSQEPEAESAWGVLTPDSQPQQGRTFSTGTAGTTTYRVRAGDSLCGIAAAHGVTWRELYHENRAEIGDDPRLIHPGEYLTIER